MKIVEKLVVGRARAFRDLAWRAGWTDFATPEPWKYPQAVVLIA